jgi:hypothetical protein
MGAKPLGIFISHSWEKATEEYEDLAYSVKGWVREEYHPVVDYSIPEERKRGGLLIRLPGALPGAIEAAIKKSDLFIFVAYPKPSRWMVDEVNYARKHGAFAFAVKPPGYERIASIVSELGMPHCDYDGRSVRALVRRGLKDIGVL